MNWINLLLTIPCFLALWPMVFLLHEWFHIKSQGILMKGTIDVRDFGMTCSANQVIYNKYHWYFLSGGLLSGIVAIILGLMTLNYGAVPIYVSLFMLGVMNILYGFYEAYVGIKYRYVIYVGVIILLTILFIGIGVYE